MCFSASASFVAAGVLGVIGVVTVRKAWYTPMRWFALMPVLFAVQQAIEGVQWLVDKPSVACSVAGYGFLFFALILWPVYVPFAIYAMERETFRKLLLRCLTLCGAIVSAYLLTSYLTSPLTISAASKSIQYELALPSVGLGLPLYVVLVTSGLWSSRRRVQVFALTVLVGFFAAWFGYRHALTSVWCFFAAASSMLVLWEIMYDQEHHRERNGAQGAAGHAKRIARG